MSIKPDNIHRLLKRAVKSQLEIGTSEIIINRNSGKSHINKCDGQTVVSNIASEIELFNEFDSSVLGEPEFDSLEAHYKQICNCQKCPLGKTRNKFVYGVGNPNADLVFIGEGPGRDEDLQGEPFVGRAGKLLDKILEAIKFTRADVYILNMVKCRPPENRDPLPEEMEACNPYLIEQLRLIKPKLICALGRVAAQRLLDTKTPLGKLRGQWHNFMGAEVLVTYHPAALLRFQAYKRETWKDMQKLRARYDEVTR